MNYNETLILQTIRNFIDLAKRRPMKAEIQKTTKLKINTLNNNITRLKKSDYLDSPGQGSDFGYGITTKGREALEKIEKDFKPKEINYLRVSTFDHEVFYCSNCSYNSRLSKEYSQDKIPCPRCNKFANH